MTTHKSNIVEASVNAINDLRQIGKEVSLKFTNLDDIEFPTTLSLLPVVYVTQPPISLCIRRNNATTALSACSIELREQTEIIDEALDLYDRMDVPDDNSIIFQGERLTVGDLRNTSQALSDLIDELNSIIDAMDEIKL